MNLFDFFCFQSTDIPGCNRKGRNGQSVEEGVQEWDLEKRQDYKKHKSECFARGSTVERFLGETSLFFFNTPTNAFELVWTLSSPRIGIIARSPQTSTLANLYEFMSIAYLNIERELRRYTRNMNAEYDCHLCLFVRGQRGTNLTCREEQIISKNGRIETQTNLVGYIQMDENEYVRWLPQDLKQIWLDAFNQTEFFVGT